MLEDRQCIKTINLNYTIGIDGEQQVSVHDRFCFQKYMNIIKKLYNT